MRFGPSSGSHGCIKHKDGAVIDGNALGQGLNLVCDLRICSENAIFGEESINMALLLDLGVFI